MSSVVKPKKFDYLANGAVEKFLFSDDDDEENDFNFKYVPTDQFKHIVKDVRRQRSHEKEEKIWSSFNKQKSVLHPLRHHLSDINLELHNIEPEIYCQTHQISKSTRSKRKNNNYEETAVLSRRNSISSIKDNDDDGDDSTLERSPISKLDVKSKNSSSDSTVKSISRKKNRLLRKINRLDCNSSPDLSSHYDSDDHDFLQVQPHPAISQKILGLQCRISELLDEISYRLCRIPPADGENDLKRRQKRMVEFGIRFSRNYLYDLGRQMAEIQRHLKAILVDGKDKRRGAMLHMQALEQKLSSSHQLVVCALTAYCNHIPSSVLEGHPDKLKEILSIVIELKRTCEKINLTAEGVGGGDTGSRGLGDDLQNRCYTILSKLHLHSDNEPHALSAPQSASNMKRRNNRLENFKVLANRFSMYTIDAKYPKTQRQQRRPVTVGVYPKDRSIPRGSLNNPPPTPEQIYATSVGQKSVKESTRKKNRINGLHREDEIKTMMDMISTRPEKSRNYGIELRNKANNVGAASSSRVSRRIHSATTSAVESKISITNCARQNSERNSKSSIKSSSKTSSNRINKVEGQKIQETQEKLNTLVPFIADLMNLAANKNHNDDGEHQSDTASIHTLLEIIEKIKQSDKSTSEAKPVESNDSNKNNMQLIVMSNEDEKEINSFYPSRDANSKVMEKKDCLTELIVSKESSQKLLNYREEYNASSSLSPMYTSNSPNKPWEVVAWIADKLVDELVIGVSKDLEITEVIQKLYDLEFFEF